jgi:hypothetical protein
MAGRVVQGVGPEIKPHTTEKKKPLNKLGLAEHLPSKHEVLSSNSSTTEKKNNQTHYFVQLIYADKNHLIAECQWLTPVVLATLETEIRRTVV